MRPQTHLEGAGHICCSAPFIVRAMTRAFTAQVSLLLMLLHEHGDC
ncbi:MAG: hypothetical protein WCF57_03555 [Pyrinomonadaceae bacterium]